MKLTPTKRVAVGLLAAALPLSMAACAKGASSSSGGAGGELTHVDAQRRQQDRAGVDQGDRQRLQRQPDRSTRSRSRPSRRTPTTSPSSRPRRARSCPASSTSTARTCRTGRGPGIWPRWRAWTTRCRSTCRPCSASTTTRPTPSATTTSRSSWSRASRSLEKYGIRIPTSRPAVDQGRVHRGAEEDQGRRATYAVPAGHRRPAVTGEWWPYAYSPLLQSFGGDLINRNDYKTRRRRARTAPKAVAVGDVVPQPGHRRATCR